MDRRIEDELRRRIAELEAENKSLKDFNELLKAQRKEHLDMILGPEKELDDAALSAIEQEMAEMIKNHVPGSGLKFLAELGIHPQRTSQ